MFTLDELKERKRQLGLTNEQIAKLSGVPLSTVQKVFGGTTSSPRRNTLEILSAALAENSYIDSHGGGDVSDMELAYNSKEPGKHQGEYTVDDIKKVSDDRLVELIDGEIFDMCYPSLTHQDIVLQIVMQLHECIEKHCADKCKVFISPSGVRINNDDKTALIPDLFVSCDRSKWHGQEYMGAPDMVVEVVSPSSRVRDRIVKMNLYWHAGCREYWIVDPDKKEVEVNFFEKEILGEKYSFDKRVPVGISDGKCEVDFSRIKECLGR